MSKINQRLPTLFHSGKGRAVPPSPAQPSPERETFSFCGQVQVELLGEETATRIRTHYTHIQAPINCPSCSSTSQVLLPQT